MKSLMLEERAASQALRRPAMAPNELRGVRLKQVRSGARITGVTPRPEDNSRDLTPLETFPWWVVWSAIVIAVCAGATVSIVLWGHTVQDHKDAFDLAWKSAAGVLAVLAAVVTVRRLRLSEREHHRQLIADRAAQADAIARQITDLSAKASEQLGSAQAAVRIGGLTDLERLGQSYPDLRRTVVDRICAYLRGPYEIPQESTNGNSQEPPAVFTAKRLELDVRRAAQEILIRHTSVPARGTENADPNTFPDYWGQRLDLRGAVLFDFMWLDGRGFGHDFDNAHFYGETRFGNLQGGASFESAKFETAPLFDSLKVKFLNFSEAVFIDGAVFRDSTLGLVYFTNAELGGAYFARCTIKSGNFPLVKFDSRGLSFLDVSFLKFDFMEVNGEDLNFKNCFVRQGDTTVEDFHSRLDTIKEVLPSGWKLCAVNEADAPEEAAKLTPESTECEDEL